MQPCDAEGSMSRGSRIVITPPLAESIDHAGYFIQMALGSTHIALQAGLGTNILLHQTSRSGQHVSSSAIGLELPSHSSPEDDMCRAQGARDCLRTCSFDYCPVALLRALVLSTNRPVSLEL